MSLALFFALKSILSDSNISILAFFEFSWYAFLFMVYIFHPFTFNLLVLLYLTCISCGQHIVGLYLFILCANLCLLIGEFRSFIFNITIDMVRA